jgi:hypothetical protein
VFFISQGDKMSLSQTEADQLLALPKGFAENVNEIAFPRSTGFHDHYDLFEVNGRERFVLDLSRSSPNTAKLKFQTRARTIFVLARFDINGTFHPNPLAGPHRPGERLSGTHIHLFHEGFGDRVAYLPGDLPAFASLLLTDETQLMIAFLAFCGVQRIPQIQELL